MIGPDSGRSRPRSGVRDLADEQHEFGSSDTIDVHLELLEHGKRMIDRRIREFVIIGSQPATLWFELPIRQAKEDGSDGVVRV